MQKDPNKQRAAAASRDVRAAKSLQKFQARLNELGAELLEDAWLGARTKHRVRCADGHDCFPMPNNVISGFGICKVCAKISPAESFIKFKERLAECGARLVRDEWLGRHTPHDVICSQGHPCKPQPGNVISGWGPCQQCSYVKMGAAPWDVFYVVSGSSGVKFGVTSGDPRARLSAHRADGYTCVERLWRDLPEGSAKAVEDAVKVRLRSDGRTPVRGVEYFASDALATILHVASAVLGSPG